MFPVTSRYHGVETTRWEAPDGREIVHLRHRFLPKAADAVVLAEHTVTDGERLDNVAARYLGDPEVFWRLCDANKAMHPDELTAEAGRRLRVPLIQGV